MSAAAPLINVYTDGASKGNPGIGGWGAVLEYDGRTRELCGGQTLATNNQMELLAVIRALQSLKRPCRIKLHTDSKYVQQGISVWIHDWKKRGWKTAAKKPVKNEILWRELDQLASQHEIEWIWVKGHNGHEGNERADMLANQGVEAVRAEA